VTDQVYRSTDEHRRDMIALSLTATTQVRDDCRPEILGEVNGPTVVALPDP
jgi:hypothetical protein